MGTAGVRDQCLRQDFGPCSVPDIRIKTEKKVPR